MRISTALRASEALKGLFLQLSDQIRQTDLWRPVLRAEHLSNDGQTLLQGLGFIHRQHQATHAATVTYRNIGHCVYATRDHSVAIARCQQTKTYTQKVKR